MVLHSLALHDVFTLWVESMFILDCSEGLAVFAGVSSSVNGHLSVSLAEWTLVMFFLCSMFHHPSMDVSRVECFPFLIRSFGFLLEGSVSCGVCSAFGCCTLG